MAELVADCPRCGSKRITFDVAQAHHAFTEHGWRYWFEVFSVCRHCNRTTTFVVSQQKIEDKLILHKQGGLLSVLGAINKHVDVESYVSLKDNSPRDPPEHLPPPIAAVFTEGAKCYAIGCHNAAGTMFRLCLDMATRELLPSTDEKGLTAKVRRDLGLRIPWLFDNGRLPTALRDLSICIKEDGNDGAHQGTLEKVDTDDLMDFTIAVLERMYTERERIRLANERRQARRTKPGS